MSNKILIAFILVLGLSLRLFCLTGDSLWGDEGLSILAAKLNISQIIRSEYPSEINPPAYFLVLHSWIKLFGDSEFSIRFLSVIFGFCAILMMYKVSSLLFDRSARLISSFLLTVSVFHIHYSQEVRNYSLMVLVALISMYFFIRLLKEKKRRVSAGYVLSSAFLLYVHDFGLFVIAAQNIYFLGSYIFSKDTKGIIFWRWALIQAIVGLLYLPWLIILIHQISNQSSMIAWIPKPSINSIRETFVEYSGSRILFLFYSSLLLLSILFFYKKNKLSFNKDATLQVNSNFPAGDISNINNFYLLLAWLLTPIIMPFIISKLLFPIYWPRYTISALPAFYILIANGISNINKLHIKIVVLSVVIIFSFGSLSGYYTKVHRPQWRDVVNYMEMNALRGDTVLFVPNWSLDPVFNYYSKKDDLIKIGFPMEGEKVNGEEITKIKEKIGDLDRIWIIISFDKDPEKLIEKTLKALQYKLLFFRTYDGNKALSGGNVIEVYLYGTEKRAK